MHELTKKIKADLPASLVVFLVALPLCLGIGLASTGRSDLVFSGVIAGIIGGIVVGYFSGSRLGVSGPAAGLVTIVLGALGKLGTFEALLLAVMLAGVIQYVAGWLRAGIIAHYFPSSVIKGMLAAIGLTLILKEIPHALGYDKDFIGDFALTQSDGHNTFSELYYAFLYNSTGAIIISAISLAVLIAFDQPRMRALRLFRLLPGALFVVVGGIGINYLFQRYQPAWALGKDHLVQLPVANTFTDFISFFRFPDFTQILNPQVYIVAITLAVVASIETLLSVEATDKLDPERRATSSNMELRAQGIGNMISGLIGGLPVTQVIVRSSANINAGATSKLSTIVHGTMLLLAVILIPHYVNMIPLASLGVILLMVGYKLSNVSLYKTMYKLGPDQFVPFLTTVVAILLTDLLTGIGLGMVVAVFFILQKNYQHAYHVKKSREAAREVITVHLSEEVTFLNKASIKLTLNEVPNDSRLIIDGTHSKTIDYDVLELIQEFRQQTAPIRNIEVETLGIRVVESSSH